MEVNDIIRHSMIMEVDASAIRNDWYYIIKDNTLATNLTDLVTNIHADWWDRLKAVISDQVSTTCSIWQNLMGNDPTFAVFQTIAGTVIGDNLPGESAVALTKKAVKTGGIISTGTIKISGLAESLQAGGHLNDYEIGLGLKSWLVSDVVVGSTIFKNVQQAKVAGVLEYNEVTSVSTNPHLVDVPSRRSLLCATE